MNEKLKVEIFTLTNVNEHLRLLKLALKVKPVLTVKIMLLPLKKKHKDPIKVFFFKLIVSNICW